MADSEELNTLLADKYDLVGPSSAPAPAGEAPYSLAEVLSEATGLPSAVITSNTLDTAEQGAQRAAMAALQRFVQAPFIGETAARAAAGIESGLGNE